MGADRPASEWDISKCGRLLRTAGGECSHSAAQLHDNLHSALAPGNKGLVVKFAEDGDDGHILHWQVAAQCRADCLEAVRSLRKVRFED